MQHERPYQKFGFPRQEPRSIQECIPLYDPMRSQALGSSPIYALAQALAALLLRNKVYAQSLNAVSRSGSIVVYDQQHGRQPMHVQIKAGGNPLGFTYHRDRFSSFSRRVHTPNVPCLFNSHWLIINIINSKEQYTFLMKSQSKELSKNCFLSSDTAQNNKLVN